jgi:serine/threonine protein phosphatase PrpC
VRVEFAAISDIGRVRQTNEDSCCVWPIPGRPGATLLAVADGMGGHQSGEVASRLAIQCLREHLGAAAAASPRVPWSRHLADAVAAAHEQIRSWAEREATLLGMGTTLTALVVAARQFMWGHVGDSRAYLWREGALRQLTLDHSLVEELVREGRLDEGAALTHPQRHVLTQALGMAAPVSVDTGEGELAPGDWLLLATDVLTGCLSLDEVGGAVASATSAGVLARFLVDTVNARGGPDNVTIVIARA